ncbi:GyrI-like domain-containing protein [Pinisolibacter sp.]|uniref:GyrI-like domain-containing protein n=1 Tax=Pinisolibacter sp. TaxID=2172024 RepID=UPI002FDCA1B6
MTAKMSAAALFTLGSLAALPAVGLAQEAAPKPAEAPAAAAAAPAAPAPAPAAAEAPKPAAPAEVAPAAPAPAEAAKPATPAPAEAAKPAEPAPAAEAAKPAAPAPAAAPAEAAKPAAPAEAGKPAAPDEAAAPAPDSAEVAPPEEVDLPERPVLAIEGHGAWEEAEDKLGNAFEQLAIAAKKAGVKPDGAPLVEYVESDENGFSFVVMLPVDKAPGKGKLPKGVKADVSPAGPALRFSPSAAADDLDAVYSRIDEYLAANGLTVTAMIEEYGEDAIASPEDRVVVDIYVFVE